MSSSSGIGGGRGESRWRTSRGGGIGDEAVRRCHAGAGVVWREPALERSKYCPRCRRFVQQRDLRAGTMREAWGREGSGAAAPGWSWTRPIPGAPGPSTAGCRGTLVVAAWWVKERKTGLSEGELWKVVGEYERYLREGGEFDREVVGFEHWRRACGRRR